MLFIPRIYGEYCIVWQSDFKTLATAVHATRIRFQTMDQILFCIRSQQRISDSTLNDCFNARKACAIIHIVITQIQFTATTD